MPTITVTVLRNGKPAPGHRVGLEVSGLTGGFKPDQYTDSQGRVYFEVDYGQEGNVYVDGSRRARWGSYSATDITINL